VDRLEQLLAEPLLRRVLDEMPFAVLITESPSGRPLFTNSVFVELSATDSVPEDRREWIGYRADGTQLEPDDWPLSRTLATGEVVRDEEIRIRRGDGLRTWLSVDSSPIRDEGGVVLGALVTFVDVTARRTTELDLAAAERRTELTLESMADAFFLLDEHWRFQYVNRKAEELLGRPRHDLIGNDFWVEFPDAVASKFLDEFTRARDEQVVVAFEGPIAPLGRTFEVRVYPGADGRGLAVYFQDARG
jgi:PAS domain S-box-containing protein